MDRQEGIQLNKYISSSGFCSRREADKLIDQGRVTMNGRIALPTARVGENDKVAIDDETIRIKKKEPFYIAFNKPQGITSTTDLKDKSNIISFINHNRRIFPIGRLDKDSEGLILLTDDGDIVNKILRAENNHEKEYLVTVNKPIAGEFINKMASGVPILDTVTLPCKVRQEGNKKFRIILTQGLNRQIRRMCEYMGYEVSSLKRIRIMHIQLGDIPSGKYRKLLPSELNQLLNTTGGSSNNTTTPVRKKKNTGAFQKNIKNAESDLSRFYKNKSKAPDPKQEPAKPLNKGKRPVATNSRKSRTKAPHVKAELSQASKPKGKSFKQTSSKKYSK